MEALRMLKVAVGGQVLERTQALFVVITVLKMLIAWGVQQQ